MSGAGRCDAASSSRPSCPRGRRSRPGQRRRSRPGHRAASTTSAAAPPHSTAAPSTSPVIPPSRRIASAASATPTAQPPATARSARPAASSSPASAEAASGTSSASDPRHRTGHGGPEAVRSSRGDASGAQDGQRASPGHRRERQGPRPPRRQPSRQRRDLHDEHQHERGRTERADVAAPHDLEGPTAVGARGRQPVDGVGQPVEVQAAGRPRERGDSERRREEVSGAGSPGELDHGRGRQGDEHAHQGREAHRDAGRGPVHLARRRHRHDRERARGEERAVAQSCSHSPGSPAPGPAP